jgi:DNA (cytosine-5)-methyltransferase 1
MHDILEDFAGPGGWDEGARLAGSTASIYGREIQVDAVATARAAGHTRKHVDIQADDPAQYRGVTGYIASPPCQTFSTAGKGAGREAIEHLKAAAYKVADGMLPADAIAAVHDEQLDVRSVLVLEPLRVIAETSPSWVAMEQVPNALPVFEVIAEILREQFGYHVRTGIVSAEEYGVPQTRRRAILTAVDTTLADEAPWPTKTHSKFHSRSPQRVDEGYQPPVAMAEALGWRAEDMVPERFNDQSGTAYDAQWPLKRPATAVAGRGLVQNPGATANRFNGSTKSRNDGVKVTVAEAGVLQSFRADYPWQGTASSQYQRVGDAIPPLLAAAVLEPLLALSGLLATEERTAASA